MTDNTTLPGTGDTIADDDISGVKYQRVKLITGNDGSNDGDVSSTNAFPTKGLGFSITNTLTVSTSGYSLLDVAGGLITFANAVSAVNKRAVINTLVLNFSAP